MLLDAGGVAYNVEALPGMHVMIVISSISISPQLMLLMQDMMDLATVLAPLELAQVAVICCYVVSLS